MAIRRCGRCDRMRPIAKAARDGQPDICDCCYQPPTRVCSLCGRERPCLFADSAAPVCRSCRARTAAKKEPCAICGDQRRVCRRSPIGAVCERCRDRRLRERAVCSGCGERRRPATFPPAAVLCAACAGLPPERSCRDCGGEDEHEEVGRCARCALAHRVAALAASGDRGIVSRLGPYLDALAGSRTPRSAVMWLRYSPAAELLSELLAGELELSHEALDERDGTGTTAVTFLRAAFVEHGILPARSEDLVRLERWTRARLAGAAEDPDWALVRAYAIWKVTRDLADRAGRGEAGRTAPALARSKITRALELTGWLHERQLTLSDLRQDLLDDWLAEGSSVRRRVGEFVVWLNRSGVVGPLEVARPPVREPTVAAADRERLATVARLLTDEQLDLADRVAGCLVLLFAQPAARVARLRDRDIRLHDGQVFIAFGREPAPLTAALGALVLRLRAERRGPAATAAIERSAWLFAGSKLGTPIADSRLTARLRKVGVEPLRGRTGALAHLLHRVPAPVLADQIGMSPWTAQKWNYLVSPDYARYVARRQRVDARTSATARVRSTEEEAWRADATPK